MAKLQTIAGPFADRSAANETAKAIGSNCSVYSVAGTDADGYSNGTEKYYVERDDSMPSGQIFGYDADAFMARQYR